jgi:hypothetical protein
MASSVEGGAHVPLPEGGGEVKLQKKLSRNDSVVKAKAFGEAFKVYLFIECCVWLPCCYAACYRFAPTLRLMETPRGRSFVKRASDVLASWTPTWHARLTELSSKINGAPASRAFAEWALINKILAPIGFPTKMWIAHKVVSRRGEPP